MDLYEITEELEDTVFKLFKLRTIEIRRDPEYHSSLCRDITRLTTAVHKFMGNHREAVKKYREFFAF